MLFVIWVCLGVGFIFGWIGAGINHTPLDQVLRHVRDYVAWPSAVFIGYRLLPNQQSAWRFVYVLIIGGVFAATMSVTHFAENAEFVTSDNINVVRSINYMVAYAGIASLLLTYSALVRQVRLLPFVLTAPIAGYCLLGECAPMARGEWLSMIVCFSGMLLIIPPGKRLRTLLKGLIVGPCLLVTIYLAIQGASDLMHRDFGKIVQDRLYSLLPTERVSEKESKAWDTRLPSMRQEIGLWLENPLTGQGFSAQNGRVLSGKMVNMGAYFHNGWSSVLATTGLFGFVGFWSIIVSMFVIGRRMVRTATDRATILFGALAFFSSLYLFIGALSGMVWGARLALMFGIICGMMFRLRDIQNTSLANPGYDEIEITPDPSQEEEQSFVHPF